MPSLPSVRSILPAALAFFVAGCSQPEAPPDQFFRVAVDVPQASAPEPTLRGILQVERPDADGLLAGRSIVYAASEAGAPFMEYSYEFWDKPPSLMIRDELVRCMEGGRMAERIVTEQARVDANYSLIGQLVRFERIEGAPPRAVVETRLGLRDNFAGKLLLWRKYAVTTDATDDTMPATVAAFGAAISEVCTRLTADLNQVL